MGFFNKMKNLKNKSDDKQGVVPFEDFKLIMKPYIVDGIYSIGIPVGWNVFESDRFRCKTEDEKTQMSITNWNIDNPSSNEDELRSRVLPLYDKYVDEGGYVPYDDFFINENQISKSFKVDNETQYFLTTINAIGGKTVLSSFIIHDIGTYDPQMRATLLNIVATMQFR